MRENFPLFGVLGRHRGRVGNLACAPVYVGIHGFEEWISKNEIIGSNVRYKELMVDLFSTMTDA
jgi:hypothetical protein